MQAVVISNKIRVDKNEGYTKVIKYRDRKTAFGFEYATFEDLYQQVRIHLDLQNYKHVTKEKIYRKTSGRFAYGSVSIDKKYDLVTDQIDESTADALSAALKHSEFYIDGVAYSSQGELEADDENDFNEITRRKIAVFLQGYNQTNISC